MATNGKETMKNNGINGREMTELSYLHEKTCKPKL
jgi:hypothetical protein